MRLTTFESNGARRAGFMDHEHGKSVFDLTSYFGTLESSQNDLAKQAIDVVPLIQRWSDAATRLQQFGADPSLKQFWLDQAGVKFRAPIDRPGKIICLAGNYREHIIESGFEAPLDSDVITQQLFLKPATSLIGDGDDIVIRSNNVTLGWETELAVIIGKSGRDIDQSQAMDYVFGYTILNDISERGLNSRIENRKKRERDGFFDWLAGKWFDGFAPCGPWIVTADEISDPHNLAISLTVNGELRQEGNTSEMIFRIPEQIAYTSSIMTLEAGDIISTGTPVGAGIGGEASLKPGDELVCEIEKIGSLTNRVVTG